MTVTAHTYVSMSYNEILQHIEPLHHTRNGFRIVGMLTPGGDLAPGYESTLTKHGDVAYWAWGMVHTYVSPSGRIYLNDDYPMKVNSPQRVAAIHRYKRQFLGDSTERPVIESVSMDNDHGETFMELIMESLRNRLA